MAAACCHQLAASQPPPPPLAPARRLPSSCPSPLAPARLRRVGRLLVPRGRRVRQARACARGRSARDVPPGLPLLRPGHGGRLGGGPAGLHAHAGGAAARAAAPRGADGAGRGGGGGREGGGGERREASGGDGGGGGEFDRGGCGSGGGGGKQLLCGVGCGGGVWVGRRRQWWLSRPRRRQAYAQLAWCM